MHTYIYNRTFQNGKWNIDNPNDVDVKGHSVPLADRIRENGTIGSKLIKVKCDESQVYIEFNIELDTSEQTILDNIVNTHINASGTINLETTVKLYSPNGTLYNLRVNNLGVLIVTPE